MQLLAVLLDVAHVSKEQLGERNLTSCPPAQAPGLVVVSSIARRDGQRWHQYSPVVHDLTSRLWKPRKSQLSSPPLKSTFRVFPSSAQALDCSLASATISKPLRGRDRPLAWIWSPEQASCPPPYVKPLR